MRHQTRYNRFKKYLHGLARTFKRPPAGLVKDGYCIVVNGLVWRYELKWKDANKHYRKLRHKPWCDVHFLKASHPSLGEAR